MNQDDERDFAEEAFYRALMEEEHWDPDDPDTEPLVFADESEYISPEEDDDFIGQALHDSSDRSFSGSAGRENAYRLLTILQSYAPTGSAQELCAGQFRQLERDAAGDWKTAHIALAGSLLNGLRHGNWPWSGSASVT